MLYLFVLVMEVEPACLAYRKTGEKGREGCDPSRWPIGRRIRRLCGKGKHYRYATNPFSLPTAYPNRPEPLVLRLSNIKKEITKPQSHYLNNSHYGISRAPRPFFHHNSPSSHLPSIS